MSQNATPATEFAPCRHLTQPCQCDLQKTRNATRLKCCACHENCHASSENVAKVLRLPHKTISTRYKTRLNVTKCHACHAKRSIETLETSKNDPSCRTYHRQSPPAELTIGTAIRGSHERLRTVANRNATSSEHTLNPQTPRVKREPLLRIREKNIDPHERPFKLPDTYGV